MTNRPLLRAPFGVLLLAATAIAFAQQPAQAPAKARALPTATVDWKGDFDGMMVSEGHSL